MRIDAGRIIITVALLATMVAPILADWNETHVFSVHWSPHARFHGVVASSMAFLVGALGLWLLWRRSAEPRVTALAAGLLPLCYWGPFFLAALIPGTGYQDPAHPINHLFGVLPMNFVAAFGTCLSSGIGIVLDRRLRLRAEG